MFRFDFSYDTCLSFLIKPNFIGKKEGYYNDDRTISKFRVNHDHYILDLIIKKHTNDKNLLCTPKNTNLFTSIICGCIRLKN